MFIACQTIRTSGACQNDFLTLKLDVNKRLHEDQMLVLARMPRLRRHSRLKAVMEHVDVSPIVRSYEPILIVLGRGSLRFCNVRGVGRVWHSSTLVIEVGA